MVCEKVNWEPLHFVWHWCCTQAPGENARVWSQLLKSLSRVGNDVFLEINREQVFDVDCLWRENSHAACQTGLLMTIFVMGSYPWALSTRAVRHLCDPTSGLLSLRLTSSTARSTNARFCWRWGRGLGKCCHPACSCHPTVRTVSCKSMHSLANIHYSLHGPCQNMCSWLPHLPFLLMLLQIFLFTSTPSSSRARLRHTTTDSFLASWHPFWSSFCLSVLCLPTKERQITTILRLCVHRSFILYTQNAAHGERVQERIRHRSLSDPFWLRWV